MKKLIAVSDATPLIALSKLEKLSWLRDIFGEVIIPEAVYEEIVVKGQGRAGYEEIKTSGWIRTIPVADRIRTNYLLTQLDPGESEAIVLAEELNADWLLMDEIHGRAIAQRLGLSIVGTVGILVLAKQRGWIPEVRALLDALIEQNFWLSQAMYKAVLRDVGELKD